MAAVMAVIALSSMQAAVAWVPPPIGGEGGGGGPALGRHNFLLQSNIKIGSNSVMSVKFYIGIDVYLAVGGAYALTLAYGNWVYYADNGYSILGRTKGVSYGSASTNGFPASVAAISFTETILGPSILASNYDIDVSVSSICHMYITSENIGLFSGWSSYTVAQYGDDIGKLDQGEHFSIVAP